MSSEFSVIQERIESLLSEGQAEGWLTHEAAAQLAEVERAKPGDLFTTPARPLVVAFFGGTGAGKSSLLNRLADADVARVGVERPTSREVTLYVHRDVELAEFPQNLPLESVTVSRHGDARRQDVMWVDMPDIDSTEASNRTAALAWLPHVDLVVYVVSPERYRDDVGWRVLLERGHRHGWMFVINRWDEGAAAQKDDFNRLLKAAGFEDPLVLSTACITDTDLPSRDEFPRIEQTLRDLLDAHGLRELERLGQRAKLDSMRAGLQTAASKLGTNEQWAAVRNAFDKNWMHLTEVVRDGLAWPATSVASSLAADPKARSLQTVVVGTLLGNKKESEETADTQPDADQLLSAAAGLWDDWARQKLARRLDAIETAAERAGVALPRLRMLLDDVTNTADRTVQTALEDEVRSALAKPGTALQRMGRIMTGFLMTVLPAVALLYVAVTLMRQYHNAASGLAPFPGGNFAISSVLIVAMAWGLPFWLDRMLKPSLERAVQAALQRGLDVGLALLGESLRLSIGKLASEAADQQTALEKLSKEIAGVMVRPIRVDRPEVGRLISTRPLQHEVNVQS